MTQEKQTIGNKLQDIKKHDDHRKKKIKLRYCNTDETCMFKNIYWNEKRCLAPFIAWRTCRNRGEEKKQVITIDNGIQNGEK